MSSRRQAKAKGGGLHFVLGNHETLVLLGARQYLNPKYRASAQALGVPAYALLWDERTLLGRWLRTKPSVQKIGGYLCLHGGLSAEIVNRGYTLDADESVGARHADLHACRTPAPMTATR